MASVCQWCGKPWPTRLRAPSFKHGSKMFEQFVCGPCHDKAVEELAKRFPTDRAIPHKCCGCGCDMNKGDKVYQAQTKPKPDGSWSTTPLCEECFGEHGKCCDKAKQRGGSCGE